ncbi:MAG: 8-oxo-dGTP diphosphatase MutT [Limisphaerales bacterium]
MKTLKANQQAIDVSAALIFDQGRLLITERQAGSHLGGLWEFPGGKREPKETFEQCIIREIMEELGMIIAAGELFEELTHAYRERTVHLKFFLCDWIGGQPQALGCASFKWIAKDELLAHAFPAADAQLLEKLSRNWVGT